MDTAAIGCEGDLGTQASTPSRDAPLAVLESHFERFYRRVYAYLVHRLLDPELAAELAAESFYRAAAQHGRLYGNERQIEAWLLRTATRLADSHYRRTRLHRLLLGRFVQARAVTQNLVVDGHFDGPGMPVREVLRKLPPKHQSVVVLRYYLEMSIDDMAVVLECRPAAVRARLSRAMKEMHRRLAGLISPE